MKSKFIKNFLLLTFSTLIINIIEMITNVYITNKIGTTVLGSYSLIINVFNFLVTTSLFGIPLTITKLVSENDELKKDKAIEYSSKIACKICAVISVSVCIFTILNRKFLVSFFLHNSTSSDVFIILALSLPFIALTSCFCGYFNALRKVNKPVSYEILTHVIRSFTIIVLLKISFPAYKTFATGLFLSEFISFLYSYSLYKKDVKIYSKSKEAISKKKILKDIFRISAPLSFTSFVRSGLSALKHTLIPLRLQKFGFSYEYALSRYGIIHGISLPFILIPSIFINSAASLLLPEYSRYFAAKDTITIKRLTEKIFKTTILLSLYISFIIYISSDYICFKLYNNVDVSYYVKILTPLICIIYLDYIADSILRGLDLQVNVMKINIIDLIISISLIYFGIPYLGTWGYILVLYVSEYINGIMSIDQILSKTKIKFKYYEWIIKPLLCLFTSFWIIKLLKIENTNFSQVLMSIFSFTLSFIFLSFLSYKKES